MLNRWLTLLLSGVAAAILLAAAVLVGAPSAARNDGPNDWPALGGESARAGYNPNGSQLKRLLR